jgi:hypothetical protein
MKVAYALVFLLLTSLTGCLQEEIQPLSAEDPIMEAEKTELVHSYQFDNLFPMGQGNTTELYLENGTEVNLTLWARFHEPLAWEQGYVNVSISGPGLNVSVQNNSNVTNYLWMINVSGNHTIEVLSEGSDDQTDNLPGDAYIAEFNITVWRVVE